MTKLNKRIMSALLAAILFLTNFPMVSSASNDFAITYEGKTVSQVEFFEHEKITVSAQGNPGSDYQWQIQIPGTEQWVNIQGQTGQTIKLSKAVVGSLLVNGSAYVRCAAINDGEEIDHTAALRTTVKKEEPAPVAPVVNAPVVTPVEPVPEATEAPTEAPAEPIPETTEPPVEVTEAPIEPIPEATEGTIEETAAPTEPAVENEPVPEVVEPSEVPVETTEIPEEIVEIPAETAAPSEPEAEVVATAPAEEPATAPVEEEPAETFVDKVVKFFAPRAAADESSDIEIVTVTVHYRAVDRENKFETTHKDAGLKENAAAAEPVTDPYVAHIVSGTDLEVTVPCHVMPGYTLTVPAFHKDDPISVISNNLVLNLSGVTEDQTFYIYYVESEVSYTARYFMQNVYNDLYTERTDILTTEIQNKMKGYPNAEPDPEIIYPDIYGFTALFFQPDTIAADGSTVFEVYYDRNYYLMNFNMLGGFGTAPVYARYGTAFTVANPTKAGHVFTQWELETVNGVTATDAQKAEAFPTTIPAENRTYKAVWVQGATSYTVAYWLENANTTGYSFHSSKVVGLGADGEPDGSVESDDRVSAADYASDTAIFGIDGPFVFYDNTKTLEKQNSRDDLDSDQKVIVQGDGSTVLNVYFKRKEYNLKFYYAMKTVDDKRDMDGHQYVYVIGGSTYHFGSLANNSDTGNDVAILSQYMAEDKLHRGWVKEVPELNAYGKSRGYTTGTEEATVDGTEYLYYYLMFSARYGQDISTKWPCDVFEPAERADTATDYNGWSGTKAYASAWNGEHHVWYSQNTPNNQTIKGKYQKLDHQILWASEFGDPADGTVSYLCFWENGTEASGLTWSVPKLWYYRLWLPVLGDVPEGKETTTRMVSIDGTQQEITYVLSENYATCDDSGLGGQTFISIDGYGDDTRDPGEKDIEVGFKEEIKDNAAKTELKAKYGYTDEMLSTYKEVHIADFFYGRTNYCLKYHNRTGYIGNGEGAEVPYGKSLVLYGDQGEYVNKTKMETTHYPKEFEPNAYTFEGWYTSEDCLPGTEMVWTGTMPARNVEVYAKWEPVKYNTYFYMDYERYMDGTPFHTATNTSHGESILSEKLNELQNLVFKDKTNEANTKYLFVNWFYIDTDGTKKAFNPSEMAVRKELHLFAEWTSSEVKEYTVSYHQGKWNETTKEY